MKKLIILFAIALIHQTSIVSAQLLANTTWRLYDQSGSSLGYFHFGTDTISYSSDGVSYTNSSLYFENGNTFKIVDLPGSSCGSDTGTYTFFIQDDTLHNILVSDNCIIRPSAIVNFHWVNQVTDINENELSSAIRIYPNPASDIISISGEGEKVIEVFDMQGQLIKTKQSNSGKLSLKELSIGNYIISVLDKKHTVARKIISKVE